MEDINIAVFLNNLNTDRYKGFTIFPKPRSFTELFSGKDYNRVQVHDITPIGDHDIIGFAGAFSWKNGKITPWDGDTYNDNMSVWGYKEYVKGEVCLDVLSDDW